MMQAAILVFPAVSKKALKQVGACRGFFEPGAVAHLFERPVSCLFRIFLCALTLHATFHHFQLRNCSFQFAINSSDTFAHILAVLAVPISTFTPWCLTMYAFVLA